MVQKTGDVYSNSQQNSFYNYIQHKEIYLEYPFSGSKDADEPFLIKELAEKWTSDIKDTLRPSSYACYQNNMEKYILPYIGEMPATLFNADILSEILAFLKQENDIKKSSKEEPFSQYTLYLIENIMRAMCRYGAEKGFMQEISFGKAEYKIKNKKEALPLSELEMHQLVCVVDKQKMDVKLQVLLPLYTGISLSELCGLKWKDIDLENGKIHIHRNLVRIQQKSGNTKGNKSIKSNDKKNEVFEDNCENIKNDKKSGKIQPATILAECELPENECREFIIPEKLHGLLKVIYVKKKPSKEHYVAEVNKKTGRKKETVVEKTKYNKAYVIQEGTSENKVTNEFITYPPPDSRTLQYRLKNVGEAAWIEDLNYQRLRDTFAVMCLQAGGDVYSLAYVMGIGTGAVCDRYGQWVVKNCMFLKRLLLL